MHLNAGNESRLTYLTGHYNGGNTNSAERQRLLGILHKAIEGSLTDMQRVCLTSYYSGIPQKQIAAELGVSCSTVCRHIKYAESKLRKIADCYC